MTVVCGAADGSTVVVAADRRLAFAGEGGGSPCRKMPGVVKVHRILVARYGSGGGSEDVIVAGAGTVAILSVIRHDLPRWLAERNTTSSPIHGLPAARDDGDALEAWVFRLGCYVDDRLRDLRQADADGDPRGECLVGVRGALFETGGSTVVRIARGYCGIGSGSAYALGAMHAARELAERQLMPEPGLEWLALLGVSAAAEHDPSSGDGVDVETVVLRAR